MKNVFLSAGEISGDLHGSYIIKGLKDSFGDEIFLFGLGGKRMVDAGMTLYDDITLLSSVGFVEPLSFLIKKIKIGLSIKKLLKTNNIDTLILIDNQGFNIPLAKWAKKYNVKTIYYFPPHVSIWGKWNVRKLKDIIDLIICTLEKDYHLYLNGGAKAIYYGHPFRDIVEVTNIEDADNVKNSTVVGILPGSRQQEVHKFLRIQLDAARLINKETSCSFMIPISNEKYFDYIKKISSEYTELNIQLINEWNYDILNKCKAFITSSGTVTLELALLGKPMVIVYKISPITFYFGKKLVSVNHIGLPNILLEQTIVPELLQAEMNPKRICSEILKFLNDTTYYKLTSEKLLSIKSKLGIEEVLPNIVNEIKKVIIQNS